MRRGSSEHGFTLLELLVGLVLLGLMAVLMSAVLPLGIAGAERTRETSETIDQVRAAHNLLRVQIGEMPPIVVRKAHNAQLVFSGTPDLISFPAFPLSGQGGAAPIMAKLSAEKSRHGIDLIYAARGERKTLYAGAREIAFAYFGREKADGEAVWQTSWRKPDRPPLLIRVSLTPSRGESPWPDLVIAPAAQRPPR